MSEIKTRLAEKLSNILSLISPIRWLRHTYVLNPVIDYHKTMSYQIKHQWINVAGDEIIMLAPPEGYGLKIISGNYELTCNATAANRTVVLTQQIGADPIYWWRPDNPITANQSGYIYINEEEIDDTNLLSNYGFYRTPNKIEYPCFYMFVVGLGQAGDLQNCTLLVEYTPSSTTVIESDL